VVQKIETIDVSSTAFLLGSLLKNLKGGPFRSYNIKEYHVRKITDTLPYSAFGISIKPNKEKTEHPR
jgi:hypothetical protein